MMYGKGEYHNKYQELVFMIFAIKMETFFFSEKSVSMQFTNDMYKNA